jgi:hypothetical protein
VFDEATLRARGITERDLDQIRRRNVGGVAGRLGSRYEEHYAVHRSLGAAIEWVDSQVNRRIGVQTFCFVDDVVIKTGSDYEFCQLKTSPTESWDKSTKKLAKEFRGQKRICQQLGIQFQLALINPDHTCVSKLKKQIPKDLRRTTRVEQFPVYPRRPQAWSLSSASNAFIQSLCAFGANHPNQREQLVVAFYNALIDANPGSDGFLDIRDLIEHVRRDQRVPLRFDWNGDETEWKNAQHVLSSIRDLSVRIDHGFCHFKYLHEEGLIARCDTREFENFVDRVNRQKPQTFDAFWKVIP